MAFGAAGNIDECNRDKASISTFGVLSLALWSSVHRNVKSRAASESCFKSFLGACLPGLTLDDMPWETWLQQFSPTCVDHVVDNRCCHMVELHEICNVADKPQALLKMVKHMMFYSFKCQACAKVLNEVLGAIAQGIFDEWDERSFSRDVLRDAPVLSGLAVMDGSLFLQNVCLRVVCVSYLCMCGLLHYGRICLVRHVVCLLCVSI